MGSLSAPPYPLAAKRGPTSKGGRGGDERGRGRGTEGNGGRGRGEGRRRVGKGEGKEEGGEGTPRKNLTNPALVMG